MESASYYADGEVIGLVPADLVAVDLEFAAAKCGVPSRILNRWERTGRHLKGDMVLVGTRAIGSKLRRLLEDAGAAHPAFYDPTGAITVVLPEIRVEAGTPEARSSIEQAIAQVEGRMEVVRDGGSRLVLRPVSGRGMDALELANAIYERAAPAMSQPRLLRLVQRPSLTVRGSGRAR